MAGEDLIERAWDAFEDERYEEAEALGRRALMVDPEGVDARIIVAQTLIQKDDCEGALPLLQEAVERAPRDSEARTLLGIALFERCEFPDALAHLRVAVRLDSRSADAHYWLALALERGDDYHEADESLARAGRLDPEQFPPPVRMSREECRKVVEEARAKLPREYDLCLENVAIRIEDLPDEKILREFDPPMDPCLLGLYVGVPLPDRIATDGEPRMPDQVFLFQRNLERTCHDRETLVEEITRTLYHEIGHYMGHDDDELAEMGMA